MSARVVAFLTMFLAIASTASGQAVAPIGRARITYLASGTAYLDAGRDDGLKEGLEVRVVRAGAQVGVLTVTYLASHRSACTVVSSTMALSAGDSVEFAPVAKAAAVDSGRVAGVPGTLQRTRSSSAANRVRGRVGLRYLLVRPLEGNGFTQPAADLRLDAPSLGGGAAGFLVDIRARQTYSTRPDGSVSRNSRTGVYQAAVLLQTPRGPAHLTLGRQYLPTVSSVSLFDGALAQYQKSRFGLGVFAGSEPDPVTMGYSNEIRSYGLFVEGRSSPGNRTRWNVTGGAVGSYAGGTVNREFAFLQASLATPGVSLFLAQELDVNRDWKAAAGEPGVELTSTFASVMARPAHWLSLQVGLDNRRNVRLYRDFVSPETLFDDSFRQGVWGGTSFTIGPHVRAGVDARASLGGADSASRTRSGTAYLGFERLTPANLGLRTRYTRYSSVQRTGTLQSFQLGVRPMSWLGFEGNGGFRAETGPLDAAMRRTNWLGLDVDVSLGRRLFLLFSGSRERGSLAAGDQIYGSMSYRF
jgi:hypothetical protein